MEGPAIHPMSLQCSPGKRFRSWKRCGRCFFNIVEKNVGEVYPQRHELLLQERE